MMEKSAVLWIHKEKMGRNRDCTYQINGMSLCCKVGVLTEGPRDAYVSLR